MFIPILFLEFTTFKNETQFSFHSYLIIKNISTKFNEYKFDCTAEKKIQSNAQVQKIETKTQSIKLEGK